MAESFRIEPSTIQFPPTYISTTNRLAIKIFNEDNIVSKGEWKKYSSIDEENQYTMTLDFGDPQIRASYQKSLQFNSEVFQIEPLSIEIWPNRYQQLIVNFTPKTVGEFNEIAYFTLKSENSQSNPKRYPLILKGISLPPTAQFNVNQINIGHVMLDSEFEYQVILQNVGKVDLNFHLDQPTSRCSSRNVSRIGSTQTENIIKFTPEQGTIIANNSIPINIQFTANHVGQFNQLFTFSIDGYETNKPQIIISGKVLGPSFKIDKHSIDFGLVSYGFLYTESFEITNESQIPFEYNLHFSNDGSYEAREFNIVPATATIPKFGKQKITVEFIPIRIQDYNVKLQFDAPKFDDLLFSMPVTAKCICPEISIENSQIDLGQIYIGYKYETTINLIDKTQFPAKFEFIDVSDTSTLEAEIVFLKPRGIVQAKHTEVLPLTVTPFQLGRLKFIRFVRIFGSDIPSIPFTISALCIGPKINISSNEINFGTINVLEDYKKELHVTNDSLINSHFVATFATDNKAFDVYPIESDVLPGQTITLTVTANLNDIGTFKGRLILNFQYLTPLNIDLVARGFGSTLVPSINMDTIDFGYAFVGQPSICQFYIENKGRKNQDLRWTIQKPKTDDKQIYTSKIEPENACIPKGEKVEFVLTVDSQKPTAFSFNSICHYTINRSRSELFHPIIEGTFIQPVVEFQYKSMKFTYIHDVLQEEKLSGNTATTLSVSPSKLLLNPIVQQNQVKNSSLLPLELKAICPKHFSVTPDQFTLEPNATEYLEITFDPSYKSTFQSESFDSKIKFMFNNLSSIYSMKVHTDLIFPNLDLEPSKEIDFGIVMLNAEDSRTIKIKNSGQVPADFYWEMISPNDGENETKIFDIYPIRGNLQPNESTEIHATFFASEGKIINNCSHFQSTAICHVIGGPEYAINLIGASAGINYSISPTSIDLGQIDYSTPIQRQVSLKNKSGVPIGFKVKIPRNSEFMTMNVTPKSGTVGVNQSVDFTINAICGYPKQLKSSILIEISQFDDVQIDFTADCFYPQLKFDGLQRNKDDQVQQEQNSNKSAYEIEKDLLINHCYTQKKSLPQTFSKKKLKTANIFNGFVLSSYIVDFGQLTLGEKVSLEYSFASLTPYPISFEILSESLKGSGFSISPTSFRDIPPNEELKLTISFDSTNSKIHSIGDCLYQIPIVMTDDIGYMITIKASILIPTLLISQNQFEFQPTILGQTQIQTLQLQNPNTVSCEFKIELPQQQTNPRNAKTANTRAFTVSPSTGIIPPSSFINIDISFTPMSEKNYVLQFPIYVKYNDEKHMITLKGIGKQLRLIFEPNHIEFPSIQEFSKPSTATVDIINMEDHPIEVYSPQFDFRLFLNTLKGFDTTNENTDEENTRESISFLSKRPTYTSHQKRDNIYSRISKCSVCVIVHGPPKSGRTTISEEISKYMENIPIINLNQVWSSLPVETATGDDYIKEIQDLIAQKEYQKGFIIDGLDAFHEAADSESFLLHFLKQKGTQEELQKNPFTVLTHSNSTGCETALNYLLSALDGHAVYLIALNANEQILAQHQNNNDTEESQKKLKENQEIMNKVFNMSEEEYQALTEEEQDEVDQKREYFRNYLMTHADDLSEFSLEPDSPTNKKNDKNKKSRQKVPLHSDPFLLSVMMFQFTFGRIAERTRQGGNFYVFEYQTPKLIQTPVQEKPKTAVESQKATANGSRTRKKEKDKGDASNDSLDNLNCENENSISQSNSLLVDASLPLNDVCKEIFTYLPNLPNLRNKISAYLIPQIQTLLPDESAIGCPTLQRRPDYFTIENEDAPGDIPEELHHCIQLYIKSRKSNIPIYYIDNYEPNANIKPFRSRISMDNLNLTSVRKSVSHISFNTDAKSDDIENTEDYYLQQIELLDYTKRWTIEANSRVTINLEFNALAIGDYHSNLLFSICNCKNDIFKLPVSGSVICPDIDRNPRYIFPVCKERCDVKAMNIFDLSKNQFNFGSVLISKEKQLKSTNPLYRQDMNIKNISNIPLFVTGMFLESGHKSVWSIENPTMILNPEQEGIFRIGFSPIANEKYKNTFSIYVKDNPVPLSFDFYGEGCSPTIEISNTNIDFEKIMLNQQRTIKIDIKNTSKIGAYWKIKGGNNIGNCVTLSSSEGLLLPSKTTSIDITFSSPKPIVFKKSIQIDIFDQSKAKLFSSQNLTIAGEVFDVTFELTFPKSMNHLQFGHVKVSQQKQLTCLIHNTGKYPVKYVFKMSKISLKNIIKIDLPEGIIQAGEKPSPITFTLLSNKALKLTNSKGLTLVVIDSNSGIEKETAVIPIPISTDVVYSSFLIEPSNIIDFGISALNTNNTKELKITNNGYFPFDFEILPKIEINPPESASDRRPMKNLRSAKSTNTVAKKSPKRSLSKEFTVGHFTVQISTGTIAPNSSICVPIIFNSNIDGEFTNSVFVKISDSKEDENDGTQIDFKATCIAASIETDDLEKILPGYPLCLRYDIETVDCNAFLEDDHVFHFASQLLNTKRSIDVWLINPFPIDCQVDITLKPIDQSALHSPFDISDKQVIVEANSKKPVTIGFRPTVCNKFSANFEASVRNQSTQLNTKPKSIKFGIEGSGTLPMISLLPATEMTSTRSTIVNFGKTLVGLKKEKIINVQNVGLIPARITLKTTQKADDFEIVLLSNATNKAKLDLANTSNNEHPTSKMGKNRTQNKSAQFNTELANFLLGSNATQTIKFIYSPTTFKKGQFHILLSVQDNNAADISLTLIGEGFSEDIIFEGVDDNNLIEFKNCVVGRRQQVTFLMHNVSSNNIRFAWYNSNDFSFSPRVGHLKKHSQKEITASFISEKPLTYTNYRAAFQWAKIEYKEEDPPEWDDSMQQVSFVQRSDLLQNPNENENAESIDNDNDENNEAPATIKVKSSSKTTQKGESKKSRKNSILPMKQEDLTETSVVFVSAKGPEYDLIKVVEIKPEPLFEVIPGKLKDLSIQINAVSDFIKYEIDATEIEFAPTMMYETRISTITMTNPSAIRFDYSWNTSVFGSLRTDYAQTMKSPFSVEPNSGFIEPGESQTFNVMFSPIEVDDFNSHLTCDIKNLIKQSPPEVYVTGRSRRPICHFNLITSDYLTAGRRHPDYSSQLPENVKVIELFSKGVGQKVNKKFEIINTTEEPYEINWIQSSLFDDLNDDDNSIIPGKSIVCEIPHVMISSGKRHTAIFSYTPTCLKTIESLWEFKIPEYGVSIPLLVVGKVMPHK